MNSKFLLNHGHSLLILVGMATIMSIQGCASSVFTKETNGSVCSVWRDVSWSSKDTTPTIIEVKQNNARREGWCAGVK